MKPWVLVSSLLAALVFVPLPVLVAAEEVPASPLLAPLTGGVEVALPELDPSVPSPAAFLGYPLGSRFTHYSRIVDYLRALAAASPRVSLTQYGESVEGRPLMLVTITSADNSGRLEEIRRRHQRFAAPAAMTQAELDALVFTQPGFIWLAYGVHGNESSSAEAAMATAYVLAAAGGEWERLLRESIILLDPLSNPDGRERYLASFEQQRGREADPEPLALEHSEPWPGGRTNHYLADLNRDWAWVSQLESQYRVAAYQQWEPQVYVDFHEMGSGSSYFFPPVADPVNAAVDQRVVAWQQKFGASNARAFDALGWLFFNRQRYDLFYPAYGDSYPSLRGAVGMTYEMAGGGRAGEALRLPDGSVLTLADRLAHHLTSSLATVRTAAENRVGLLRDFAATRRAASTHLPESYLWEADQPEASALAELLRYHGVEVRQLSSPVELLAGPARGGPEERRRFPAGSYVVSTAQPLSSLIDTLLRLEAPLPRKFAERQRERLEEGLDNEFYDITAWSLQLAFNLDLWTMQGEPPALRAATPPEGSLRGEGSVGYLVAPQGLASYRLASGLLRGSLRFRLSLGELAVEGSTFPSGSLFIPRFGNPPDLEARLKALADEARVAVVRVASSATPSGLSLGSDELVPVRAPRIALAWGEGTSANAAGALWHLLDAQLRQPVVRRPLSRLTTDLDQFDVLVLPDGSGYGALGEGEVAALKQWVEAGGVVVGIGDAVVWLQKAGLSHSARWLPEEDDGEAHAESGSLSPLNARELDVPGAALRTQLRAGLPLAAGLRTPPPVLVQGSLILLPTLSPEETVLTVASEEPVASGVVWEEAQARLSGSLLVADSRLGRGRVILFAQDPAFRLFWRGTMPLFLNAVLYAPSFR